MQRDATRLSIVPLPSLIVPDRDPLSVNLAVSFLLPNAHRRDGFGAPTYWLFSPNCSTVLVGSRICPFLTSASVTFCVRVVISRALVACRVTVLRYTAPRSSVPEQLACLYYSLLVPGYSVSFPSIFTASEPGKLWNARVCEPTGAVAAVSRTVADAILASGAFAGGATAAVPKKLAPAIDGKMASTGGRPQDKAT
jgi:hypothetical protein